MTLERQREGDENVISSNGYLLRRFQWLDLQMLVMIEGFTEINSSRLKIHMHGYHCKPVLFLLFYYIPLTESGDGDGGGGGEH
jgi:hypothetical protein